jgi:hypothetical protein
VDSIRFVRFRALIRTFGFDPSKAILWAFLTPVIQLIMG